jgi:hypothetical protein
MKLRKSKPITIEIMGGLGNQLFAYIAGAYVAHKSKSPLRVFLRPKRRGETVHASSITSLALGINLVSHLSVYERTALFIRRQIRRIAIAIGIQKDNAERLSRIHNSDSIGLDKNLSATNSGYYLSGYFQCYDYFDYLKRNNILPPLGVHNPSDWYLSEKKLLKSVNPIAVHIRRGDYLLNQNSFIGALSIDYYRNAISLILERLAGDHSNAPIWVFSDDPGLVKDEFSEQLDYNFRFVDPPKDSDPAESMFLMSMSRAIVISNSTFSWWSAALGEPELVVAPSKWFRDYEDPEGLIPENWISVRSEWKS